MTISTKKPPNFSCQIVAAGCIIEVEDEVLLVQRAKHCPEPLTWCIPGGKLENLESPLEAIRRELSEELNLSLSKESFTYLRSFYKRTAKDILFHTFYTKLEKKPEITLNLSENLDFKWVPRESVFNLPLISGGKEILETSFKINQLTKIGSIENDSCSK